MIPRALTLLFCLSLLSGCSLLGGKDKTVRVVEKEKIITTEVYTSTLRAHCEDETGRHVDHTKAELEGRGIKVFASSCGILTGKMAPSLCGETTLHINIHEIDERRLSDAQALGYEALDSLEKGGYETLKCD